MDWREFVTSLVDSLAWPAAIVVLVLVLRGQLAALLGGSLRRLRVGPTGLEAEWEQVRGEVATSTVQALPPPPPATDGDNVDAELDNLEAMADAVPSVTLQQAFGILERELSTLIKEDDLDAGDRRPQTLIRLAHEGGLITMDTVEALRGLVVLRDLAAHDPTGTRVTPQRAHEYVALVRAVLYSLRASRRRSGTA